MTIRTTMSEVVPLEVMRSVTFTPPGTARFGVPEIAPVLLFTDRPAGRPERAVTPVTSCAPNAKGASELYRSTSNNRSSLPKCSMAPVLASQVPSLLVSCGSQSGLAAGSKRRTGWIMRSGAPWSCTLTRSGITTTVDCPAALVAWPTEATFQFESSGPPGNTVVVCDPEVLSSTNATERLDMA